MNSNIFDTNVKNIKFFNQIDCLAYITPHYMGLIKNVSEKIISNRILEEIKNRTKIRR